MDILSWMFTSIIVGALMGLITPRHLHVGFMGSIGMGALGGVVLSFLASVAGLLPEQQFSWLGVGCAALGAIGGHIVMLLFRKVARV